MPDPHVSEASPGGRLSFVWDYDIDEATFRRLLSGETTLGRLDRDWAAVRLLEHGPYASIVRLLGFRELVTGWPRWRDYVERLYPWQDRVLSVLRGIETGFYLSGGTAASRGYLQHRFSDDLDWFVNDDARFGLWSDRTIQAFAAVRAWRLDVGLREERFVRATVAEADLQLKIEMINDVPAHVGTITDHAVLGRLDSAENILANKVTALLDRQEPKDLADVWGFVVRQRLSLEDAITGAQSKAAGVFAPDLARVLLTASTDDWSRIQWDRGPDPQAFVSDLHRIGEGLLLRDTR